MLYIRRKDNPLMIKSFGYVKPGGLGQYDTVIYEEIEGDLPENFQLEGPLKTPQEKIREIFKKAISEKPSLMTPRLQKELLKLGGIIDRALQLGLNDAAREAIKEPTLPVELEPYRTEMLNAIP